MRSTGSKEADSTISIARALRDQLANTVDVTVLDQWLDRSGAYDTALRGLYAAYAASGGTVTAEVEAAQAGETVARANLPPDTRAMVVIMAEIGRGGMNGAVITIEEAKGRLTSAIAAHPRSWRTPGPLEAGSPLHCPQRWTIDRRAQGAVRRSLPEDTRVVQLRVVTDQPWDVATDVLVVPVVADPAFDGPLGELDRRSGGELQALVKFGELSGKRFGTALAAAGELPATRILLVGIGDVATLDRETVVRIAASAERRLAGRAVKRLAIWLSPLAEHFADGAAIAAGLVARGVLEGSYDPRTIYREKVDQVPPVLDELTLIAPGADATALAREAERGIVIAEGANLARTLSNRASNDVSPDVLADEARAIAKRHDLWIDVIEPDARDATRAWACSWRSAAAATTRHG